MRRVRGKTTQTRARENDRGVECNAGMARKLGGAGKGRESRPCGLDRER